MIDYSPSLAGAVARLRGLPYAAAFADLPAATQLHLAAAIGEVSPVTAVVDGLEALWAVRDQLADAARAVAADLAYQVMAYGFHGKRDRADAVLRHLLADAGEGPTEGLPEAPEAEARFAPTVEIVEVDPPALPAPEDA